MRKLFIVLALCGVSILNAQQLNVASYNVRNSNTSRNPVVERRRP